MPSWRAGSSSGGHVPSTTTSSGERSPGGRLPLDSREGRQRPRRAPSHQARDASRHPVRLRYRGQPLPGAVPVQELRPTLGQQRRQLPMRNPGAGRNFPSSPTTAAAAPRRPGSRHAPPTNRSGSDACRERPAPPTSSSTAPSAARKSSKASRGASATAAMAAPSITTSIAPLSSTPRAPR